MTSNSDACSLLPHMIDEIGALRGAGLARLRALRREYSRRLRDAGSRSILRLAYELKNSGVVHRFFSDELIANHKGAMECLTRRDLEQIGAGMDSWDQVDSFATIVAGPAWRAGRIGDADVAKWAHSCDRWWRRASLVCTTKLNVLGTNGDAHRTLAICKMLLDDHLVSKAQPDGILLTVSTVDQMEASMKKVLYVLLMLGWIPTLAVVTGTRWITGESAAVQVNTPVKVTRLYTGPDGKTKVEELEIPLKPRDRGSDASGSVALTTLQVRRTNQNYFLDWHPASRRQLVVTLSGESEVELEGGRKIRLGPGHILLAEDTTGQGHTVDTIAHPFPAARAPVEVGIEMARHQAGSTRVFSRISRRQFGHFAGCSKT